MQPAHSQWEWRGWQASAIYSEEYELGLSWEENAEPEHRHQKAEEGTTLNAKRGQQREAANQAEQDRGYQEPEERKRKTLKENVDDAGGWGIFLMVQAAIWGVVGGIFYGLWQVFGIGAIGIWVALGMARWLHERYKSRN